MISPSNKPRPKPDQTEADFTKDPVALLVAGAFLGVFAAGLIALVMNAMGVQWTWAYWGASISNSPGSFTKLQVLQGFALLVGGIATFALAAWRTGAASRQAHAANEQVRATFAAQQIDRAKQIAELLEDDKSEVSQISGITAAAELAMTDPERYYLRMASLIALVVRKNANKELYENSVKIHAHSLGQAILPSVLDTAIREFSELRQQVDISETLEVARNWHYDLAGVSLYKASLRGLNFRRTDFRAATFRDINFENCNISDSIFNVGTKLDNVRFINCIFRKNKISIAVDMSSSHFSNCDFTATAFFNRNLSASRWLGCNFSRVVLKGPTRIDPAKLIDCWCWDDTRPFDAANDHKLTNSISFYDAGPGGINRKAYEDAGRYGPPDPAHLVQPAPGLTQPPAPLYT